MPQLNKLIAFSLLSLMITAKGNAKLINGEDKVEKFILGKFKEDELKELKKVGKTVVEAVAVIIKESREKAMSLFN
jgi:peptidyl-tRNA hydrolase